MLQNASSCFELSFFFCYLDLLWTALSCFKPGCVRHLSGFARFLADWSPAPWKAQRAISTNNRLVTPLALLVDGRLCCQNFSGGLWCWEHTCQRGCSLGGQLERLIQRDSCGNNSWAFQICFLNRKPYSLAAAWAFLSCRWRPTVLEWIFSVCGFTRRCMSSSRSSTSEGFRNFTK